MLLGVDRVLFSLLALGQLRQTLVVIICGTVILAFFVDGNESIKHHDLTISAQHNLFISAGDIHDSTLQTGGGHLACHGAFVDQIIKLALVCIRNFRVFSADSHIGGANALMCFLRVLRFILIHARLVGKICLTKSALYRITCAGHRFRGHINAVCPHIGDQPGLIQALRDTHRLFGPHAKLAACFLLQCRCHKGR